VTLRVTGATDVYAAVDVSQMQQLTMNLVVNAIHAQPNGGEVRIGAHRGRGVARASQPQASQPESVCLVIEDDGIGMAPDVRERMFEPFFTTKEVGQGTGLGLSVVYGIVEEHAGEIDVRTAVGDGTCITIVFPQGRDDG
jgi:signal transduction histidine kinase